MIELKFKLVVPISVFVSEVAPSAAIQIAALMDTGENHRFSSNQILIKNRFYRKNLRNYNIDDVFQNKNQVLLWKSTWIVVKLLQKNLPAQYTHIRDVLCNIVSIFSIFRL